MPRLLAVAALLNVLLLLPLWLRFGAPSMHWIALEALMLPALLVLLPSARCFTWVRWPLLAVVLLVVLIGLGDAATQLAFGRSLNLYLDLPLLASVFHLLEGNQGAPAALLVVAAALLLLALLIWLLARGLEALQARPRGAMTTAVATLMLAGSGVLLLADSAGVRPIPVARTPVVDTLRFQGRQVVETLHAHRDFAERMADSPSSVQALAGLAGRDVLLVFVESYGMSALVDERYAAVLLPRLEAMAMRLDAAGLSVVSGSLASPIRGGQSWLAHGTTLSGLWIDNPLWYRLMLAADPATLVDDFRATGHRTLSMMPAITMAWPEGRAYGFDEIHAAADIDYAGPPLNWVTMPDQFTLHYFQRHIREPSDAPLFAQIALISSHAPWTPILPVIDDWESVGDGSIFARWEDAGEPPDELWQDLERVREHYALSLDYALHASLRWAEDFVDEDALMILLGDHQAAPLITGDDAGDGVPVHLISGDPALLAPFLARGFQPGMLPARDPEPAGMDRLRGWLHEDFASETVPQ
jgi:hypothetical protein